MEQPGAPPPPHGAGRAPPPPPPTAFGAGGSGDEPTGPRKVLEFGGLILLLAAVGWGFLIGGQFLAGALAMALPYSVDQSIGEMAAESYLGESTQCTNTDLVGAVEGIVERLGAGLDDEFKPLHVYVLEDETVNAFALPGGYMFVLTGLLEELESPEELIGVLGHEIGHVVKRHGIKRIAQSLWFQVLISQIFGDVGGIADVFAVEALSVVSLKFDRDQERESDDFGLDLMTRAGFDPKTFPAFFTRLPSGGVPAWFSTHPDPEDRAEELTEKIAELPPLSDPAEVPTLEVLQGPCHRAAD